jgi:hypothetical protein
MQAFSGLGLHHERLVDDHIECLPSERFSAVVDHDGNFAMNFVSFGDELTFERQQVDVFPKTNAQRAVHLKKRSDDRVRQPLLEQPSVACRSHPSVFVPFVESVSSFRYGLNRASAEVNG